MRQPSGSPAAAVPQPGIRGELYWAAHSRFSPPKHAHTRTKSEHPRSSSGTALAERMGVHDGAHSSQKGEAASRAAQAAAPAAAPAAGDPAPAAPPSQSERLACKPRACALQDCLAANDYQVRHQSKLASPTLCSSTGGSEARANASMAVAVAICVPTGASARRPPSRKCAQERRCLAEILALIACCDDRAAAAAPGAEPPVSCSFSPRYRQLVARNAAAGGGAGGAG